ncbi:hypothetical protein INT48_005863 [Thamnidium elegans]|uniref:Uncharacterized protein n=1 Tax=Thamnidium elegans TaxID=101142 RepID=A0A8H7SP83_9FUNG|nr:hypothetical protein INT48_005863 [Thamnidium elegans]
MNALFNFYGYNTAKGRWQNFLSKQKAKESAVNILLNGGLKYNKKNVAQPENVTSEARRFCRKTLRNNSFKQGEKTKMPLVIFGDGMFNKDGIKVKGHQHGIASIIYKNLKREKLGELCLININEFRTSVRLCSNHKVLRCSNCRTLLWNRDTNASKNMWDICRSVWAGGERSTIFSRQ